MTRATTTRLLTTLTGALLMMLTVVPSAQAAAVKKVFHESLTVPGGQALYVGTTSTLVFTLTNDPKSAQTFGSAEIVVPPGYSVGTVSTDVANFSASVTGGIILVTSTGSSTTGIAPGASLNISANVTPTATACDATWPTYVKQSNDFSGTGNDFQPADPAPTTTVTGANTFTFTSQPVTTQWNTAMSPAPVVTAKDPCGNVLTAFNGNVTLAGSPAALATGATVSAVAGVATFPNLTFADYGVTETLTASAAGFDSVTSSPFDVVQSLVACPAGSSCTSGTVTDPAATTSVDTTANAGLIADQLTTTVKGDPSVYGTCGQPGTTSEPPLGTTVTLNVATRSKTVTMTLPKAYVNLIPNNGTPFMDICLALPTGSTFLDKFGQTTSTGLLADCSSTVTTTCVTSRRKLAGNEIITFLLPAGDPHVSWY